MNAKGAVVPSKQNKDEILILKIAIIQNVHKLIYKYSSICVRFFSVVKWKIKSDVEFILWKRVACMLLLHVSAGWRKKNRRENGSERMRGSWSDSDEKNGRNICRLSTPSALIE